MIMAIHIHQDEQLALPVDAPGPKAEQADKSRKRATHACDRCRARKTRCDVTVSGPPCINCHIAGEDCDLSWSKRGRHQYAPPPPLPSRACLAQVSKLIWVSSWLARSHRLGKPLSEITSKKPPSRWKQPRRPERELRKAPDVAVVSSDAPAEARARTPPSTDSDGFNSCTASTPSAKVFGELCPKSADEKPGTGCRGSLPFSSLLPGGTQRHLTTGAGSSQFDDERGGPGGFIGYSFYPFVCIGGLASIHQRDFQYLEQEGCLHLPAPWILNDFVAQYFLQLHPILPIIDEGDFWQAYLRRRADTQFDRKIPLLLFQAMLYASCTVSSRSSDPR